jgi:hypothetical protein
MIRSDDLPKLLVLKPYSEIIGNLVNYQKKNKHHILVMETKKTYRLQIPFELVSLYSSDFLSLVRSKVSILRTDTDYRVLHEETGT